MTPFQLTQGEDNLQQRDKSADQFRSRLVFGHFDGNEDMSPSLNQRTETAEQRRSRAAEHNWHCNLREVTLKIH